MAAASLDDNYDDSVPVTPPLENVTSTNAESEAVPLDTTLLEEFRSVRETAVPYTDGSESASEGHTDSIPETLAPETRDDPNLTPNTAANVAVNGATVTATATVATPIARSMSSKSLSPCASAIPSFTSESPYLQSYIDREMRNLQVLTETLQDISARTRTFGKCGALMAEATRRLSSSCRLNPMSESQLLSSTNSQNTNTSVISSTDDSNVGISEKEYEQTLIMKERRQSVGDEIASVLYALGDILDEVADAQVTLCQHLEASLSISLEAFAGIELNEAVRLRNEGEAISENVESSFSRYMHGRHTERANLAGGIGGEGMGSSGGVSGMIMEGLDQQNFVTSWNKLSDHVGSQFKNWNRASESSGSSSGEIGAVSGNTNEQGETTKVQRLKKLRDRMNRGGNHKDDEIEKDPALATAEAAANLRYNLEQIRLMQANAELKRFQLLRRLDSVKTRRNVDLGESALASLNCLRAYFNHCARMIDNVTPKLTRLQENRSIALENHDAQQLPWETKQKSLMAAIGEVSAAAAKAGVIADAIRKGQVEDLDESVLSGHQSTLEEIEHDVRFWDLPRQLKLASLYQRKPIAGIIVEGWLYKKSSNRLSLNQWARRWFILDHKGVYYLKGEGDNKKGVGENSSGNRASGWMDRVKVCDVLLCTVREINCKAKGNPNLRFCFEIISPNSKIYLLQASGPNDYKMWVNGIRSCIENQLVLGKLPPDNRLPGTSGKSSKQRSEFTPNFRDDDDNNVIVDHSSSHGRSLFEDDFPNSTQTSPQTCIKNQLVPLILDANTVCADCDNIDPDWASLNLGVVICIECSGVHRSLGVHVSKVRSLRLDGLREYEYNLLLELGNANTNRIWEAGLHHQTGWSKPKGGASRKVKEEWIKSKYVWKGFLEYRPEDGLKQEDREAKFSVDLYEAARRCDLLAIQEALAKGGNVEWRNNKEGGKMALHICVVGQPKDENDIASWKGIECAELLIQNGAKLTSVDSDQHKALDCAVVGNGRREMIEYLSSRSNP